MMERLLATADPDARPLVVVVRPQAPLPTGYVALADLPAPREGTATAGTPSDRCLLLYTSGTTADPKGVQHTHDTLVYEVRSIVDLCELGPDDTVFMPSPVTHITGFLYAFILPTMTGAPVVLLDVWDPRAGVDLV